MASDKTDDFKSLQDGIQKALVSTTKSVNRLTAEDLGFQRAVNPAVATQLDDKTARFLGLSTRLLKSAARACGIKDAPALEDAEDIDVQWRSVVDVVDSVLEKADTALDEYTGLVKRKEPPTTDSVSSSPHVTIQAPYPLADISQAQKPKKPRSTNKVVRNANITKPQIHFERPVENFPTGPWKPILTKKPHASVSLPKSLRLASPKNGDSQYVPIPNPHNRSLANLPADTNTHTRPRSPIWSTLSAFSRSLNRSPTSPPKQPRLRGSIRTKACWTCSRT